MIARAGRPVAPDGNSTLRVSFGRVQGYAPRDGVWYTPQTTLAGMVAKHTDEEPFDVPDRILAAARDHGTLPVAFLADADTTGGLRLPDGQRPGRAGRCDFDRVWENVSNDFLFHPPFARNVSADVRYMLWLLDRVEGAKELLQELGIH